jgi:hypothetical protein
MLLSGKSARSIPKGSGWNGLYKTVILLSVL